MQEKDMHQKIIWTNSAFLVAMPIIVVILKVEQLFPLTLILKMAINFSTQECSNAMGFM